MKYLKFITSITIVVLLSLIPFGCSDSFLEFSPKGVVNSADLDSPENVEKLVIAAYAAQGNDNLFYGYQWNWQMGSIPAGDAYPGGSSANQSFTTPFQIRNRLTPEYSQNTQFWFYLYLAVGRINEALGRLNNITTADLPTRDLRIAEMHFLRAQTYFKLKTIFKHLVYLDENITKEEYIDKTNRELTDQEGWQWIVDEWRAAIAGLPATQADEGRPTKGAAKLFLGKTLLYKAYVQDDAHQPVSITTSELNEAIGLFEEVDASGEFAMHDDIANNWLCEEESGVESVWAIMRSHSDGAPSGRGNWSAGLNSTMGPGYGCCWVFIPSQNMANAHKTDANGHPLFDTYDDAPDILTSVDVEANNIDPRMSHGMGVLGMPYKYDPNRILSEAYARTPAISGFHAQWKDQVLPESPCFFNHTAFYTSSTNTDQMRYADALLFWAEALIQVGRHTEALPLVNRVRERAGSAASRSRLVKADGTPSGNYVVGLYDASDFDTFDKAFLRLQWERRIEFGFEGVPGRFFDMVRWGIAADWLNAYYKTEIRHAGRDYLAQATFVKGQHEYHPIPGVDIIVTQGGIVQNPGY